MPSVGGVALFDRSALAATHSLGCLFCILIEDVNVIKTILQNRKHNYTKILYFFNNMDITSMEMLSTHFSPCLYEIS